MELKPVLSRPRFVLAVPDARATAAWWIDVMGFKEIFRDDGWVFVQHGECVIHLGSCPAALAPNALGDHGYFGYVEVDKLDAYHAEVQAAGASILSAPADKPWGMREMAIATPDGHRLMFAQRL